MKSTVMRSLLFLGSCAALMIGAYNNCSGFKPADTVSNSALAVQFSGRNAFSVTVTSTGSNGAPNVPMISAIICVPGTTNCTLVSNLLLDTGSQGLRIFSSALPSSFRSAMSKSGIGDCILFAGNNVMWGQTSAVTVQMGQETSAPVPMQIVDQTFGDGGTACMNYLVAYLKAVGGYDANNPPFFDDGSSFNGILGVNYLTQDCGSFCVGTSNSDNGQYYSCSGTSCTSTAAELSQQVANPVAYMPFDNNGITLILPSVPSATSTPLSGIGYLGVGTQSNNMPSTSAKAFTASADPMSNCYAAFQATWDGSTTCGYMDSGSSCYFFANRTTNPIATDQYGNYTPSSPLSLQATMIGLNGLQSMTNFTVSNVNNSPSNAVVIPNWGFKGNSGDPFDWGIPFFFGKTVYLGNQGAVTSIGTGPYYAY